VDKKMAHDRMSVTIKGPDGKPRCRWCGTAAELRVYHDTEWGFPVGDDFRLFEKLSLEGFQSGLSWRTILAKRENFRAAFHHFDFNKIASFDECSVERLMMDEGIIRHRGKIEAVINNARLAKNLVEQGSSLAAFVWRYEPMQSRPRIYKQYQLPRNPLPCRRRLRSSGGDSSGQRRLTPLCSRWG
jgi:DNA-3-methyladenine glycosylase I